MLREEALGELIELEATRYSHEEEAVEKSLIPTEVPLTIIANEQELATLMCSPIDLELMTIGFLFSSGLIRAAGETGSIRIDETNWVSRCTLPRAPDMALLGKRVFTSGCGKGVMYSNVIELSGRRPIEGGTTMSAERLLRLSSALQGGSEHYRRTRGVHTAALSLGGEMPTKWFDDVGRHNAVDKAIAYGLTTSVDFKRCALISSGRASSEIVHKARRARIPICLTRSLPTHQAVLKAEAMGVTLLGKARKNSIFVFSNKSRISKT